MSLKTTNTKGSSKGKCKLITNMHRDQYQRLAKSYGKAQGFVVNTSKLEEPSKHGTITVDNMQKMYCTSTDKE